ncbi:MAG: hypothetical protein WB797_05150 [Nocardioides sp.]
MARSHGDDDRPAPESEGGRVVIALILGLALLAGCCYVAAYLGAGDKVPVGTRVGGVEIGGHSQSTAVALLREGLADRANTPFTVSVNGHTQQVRPRRVGLDVDYVASVRAAGARQSWSPSHLWNYYTAGGAHDPVLTLDQTRLARLVERLDAADGRRASNGSVRFTREGFRIVAPHPGLQVDLKAAGKAFWNAYLTDEPSVQLELTPTPPVIDSAAIHDFIQRFANPALSSPVELRFGHTALRLQPAAYARLLGSRHRGNRLVPTIRAKALSRLVEARLRGGAPIDAPRDATVALVGGRPHVVKSRPGLGFAPQDVASALLKAIRSPRRTAHVHASVAPASFTNADARQLRIRHPISSFTVHLRRGLHTDRLMSAAVQLDGTVLKPGDSLSLRGALGEALPGHGAGTALATGVFNAAWLGGLQLGSHANLPSYGGSYPMGRDASLFDGQDLTFIDDSPYGVLVSVAVVRPTSSHGGSLTATLWSTRRWAVTSSHSDPANVVPAGRIVGHGAHCHSRPGRDGFDVTVTRSFAPPGSTTVDHTGSYRVHYAPEAAVVCRAHHHHHHHH